MKLLARLHIWLGWLVGVPLLLWTISGLFMVSQPIETVRGAHLKATAPPLDASFVISPALTKKPVQSLHLIQQNARPLWIIAYGDGSRRRANGGNGALMPGVTEAEARQLAENSFAGKAVLETIARFGADNPLLDLRRARPSWQAGFSDGTHVYIDADTGETLAIRSQLWRVFEFYVGFAHHGPANP